MTSVIPPFIHDAWFDRNSREWVTAAYIKRAEAWGMLLPRIRRYAERVSCDFPLAANF